MTCSKCDSNRLMSVNAKSSDLNFVEIPHLNYEHDGYLPQLEGVGGGDYVDMTFCLDCGQIQNFRSLDDDQLKELLNLTSDDEDEDDLAWGQRQKIADDESDREYEEMLARKYGK